MEQLRALLRESRFFLHKKNPSNEAKAKSRYIHGL